MYMIDNDIDDKCQHPEGCMKSYFTYCPHCRLFVCINHLNQHYDTMKHDVSQAFNEIENQRICIEEQIHKIKQQRIILNSFYDIELQNLSERYQIASNICQNLTKNGNCYILTSEYDRDIKEFESIKQEPNRRTCKQSFFVQIDHILENEHQTIDTRSNDGISLSTTMDNDTAIDTLSRSHSAGDELDVEVIMDCDTDESLSSNIPDVSNIYTKTNNNGSETHSTTFPLKSKMSMKLVHSACPLTDNNAFGLSIDRYIPNIPCNFKSKTGRLTFGQCLKHLISCHRMRQKSARAIVETLLSNTNRNFDVTALDLFSSWTSSQISKQPVSSFVGTCPIIGEPIYGLPVQHNGITCSTRRPVHLYQHLRLSHGLKVDCARRLINAIINDEPTTKEIFKPNEIIFENYINRPKNRPKTQKTTTTT